MTLAVPSQVIGATRPSHPTALPLGQAPPLPLLSQLPQLHKHLLQKLRRQLPASMAAQAMPRQEVPPKHKLLRQMLQLAQGRLVCMSSRRRAGKVVRAQLKPLQGWTRLLSQHSRLSSNNQIPSGLGAALWAVPLWHQGLFRAVLLRLACPQPLSGLPAHKLQLSPCLRSSSNKSSSSSSRDKHQLPGLHPLQVTSRPPHARGVPPREAPGLCPTTALLSQAWCKTPLP